ncbi:hypothetical protein JB92DRAFT_2987910 [Gautieria morchelliformis]|nr:hypothetical protein JB92DRAFT_2987910 [Gautieria morchelliformis]
MDSNSSPPLTLSFTNTEPLEPATLAKLGLTCIPPAPQVNFKMLHLIDEQLAQIQGTYDAGDEYHRTFANDQACQTQAFELLLAQGLDIKALGDLGNCWSK